jgi:glycosyltransferase involved in cell wall biosynthesis
VSAKKVLIITYYWPPSGGSGVQRWLKFVKYLPQFGVEPYVFTPENPSFAIQDESLLKNVPVEAEVIRFPIWEPYEAFLKLSSIAGDKKVAKPTELVQAKNKSSFQKISTWIRSNFFIPDPRVFWVRPSVQFLQDIIRDNKIQTIITTGPPHSLHLIGLRLKKKNPSLKWFADFRDPWSEWGLLDSLGVKGFARKMHQRLEMKVLKSADEVITITPFYVRRFEALSGRKVKLLTNGFDEDDFRNLNITKNSKFIIRHAGIVNEKCNPRPFMKALEQLLESDQKLKSSIQVDFIGEVHPDFRDFVKASSVLSTVTTFTPSVKHEKLISFYASSALLLLILTGYKDAEGYMPGKLFEYIATGLPILGVGPANGDAAVLMKEVQQGEMIDGDHDAEIKRVILRHYSSWEKSNSITVSSSGIDKYSRRAVTKELVTMLD